MVSNGIITTVAGDGRSSYSGDCGAATQAGMQPEGVALDAVGNLFIADTGNQRIREVHFAWSPTLTLTSVGSGNAGNYTVVITGPYGSVTSAVATLTVEAPPIITVQPTSQMTLAGSNAIFSVVAVGSGPFGYSWYLASTNLIQGGTNSSFSLPDVSTNNDGNYTVVVTNAYGSVTSRVASLAVGFPPSVTNQAARQTVYAGANVNFSVTADGTGPFSYQWQCNGANLPNNIITTVAGDGAIGYAGDGGASTNASLNDPIGVAFDAIGNCYIADQQNGAIRRVDTNGVMTTVAGDRGNGYSGDGGPATNGKLNRPSGVAWDASAKMYIADQYNHRIRKVDANGIVSTVAGNGNATFAGDGGAATNASLAWPWCVAFDANGNMYIADSHNNRVRRVSTGGIITTVVGSGSTYYPSGEDGLAINASLNNPQSVAFDALGNLYIADSYDLCIRKVDTNGIITTVAGNVAEGYSGDGGMATNARISLSTDVALDASGNMYIADRGNNRVRKVDANGIITTVAGCGIIGHSGDGGAATNADLNFPAGVALDALGNMYIADSGNNRIREVHFAGYPMLGLTNVGANNAGSYSVVITSPYGCVTSAVATLTVTIPSAPPRIMASDACFGFLTNQFGFNLSGVFGQTIVVDGSSDLVNWTPLFTNTAGGSPFYYFDPASTNMPRRFYRARLP